MCLEIMCKLIIKAWNKIKLDLIQKSFERCNISNSLNGMEDYYLFVDQSDTDGESEII